ncbi:hypothetical protein FPV67DRAFT_746656 [Lyophyllum atratum]|nr:hypothetical protein FPV67DRAFT_746656 [Lyophyllum atratum]
MASGLPPIPDNIVAITAPQLIGTLFNWALWGVLSVQTYIYYLSFSEDRWLNKCLVYGTYIFECVQTAMTAADLHYWFASGYGNMTHLLDPYIAPLDTPIMCGILAAVVQCFFAFRIFKLRRSYLWICILIFLTAMVQTAGAFGAAIRAYKLQRFDRFHEHVLFPQSFHVWLFGDVVADTLIAGSMLWIFYTSKKQEHQDLSNILAKLVFLIVETNALTAGMALLSFIFYVVFPESNLFICTGLIMGKLYSNTLLVTFNNRFLLRKPSRLSTHTNSEDYWHGTRSYARNSRGHILRPGTGTFRVTSERLKPNGDLQEIGNVEIKTLKEVRLHP